MRVNDTATGTPVRVNAALLNASEDVSSEVCCQETIEVHLEAYTPQCVAAHHNHHIPGHLESGGRGWPMMMSGTGLLMTDIGEVRSEWWESREMQVEEYTSSIVKETIEGTMWKERDLCSIAFAPPFDLFLSHSPTKTPTTVNSFLVLLNTNQREQREWSRVKMEKGAHSKCFGAEGQVYVGRGSEFMGRDARKGGARRDEGRWGGRSTWLSGFPGRDGMGLEACSSSQCPSSYVRQMKLKLSRRE
ncbi:hypothetical protein B0H17DRAFT_1150324 [Mycena rosella]|uniref:Uncharacterized protein n=1 Tax=Mycena rosella TaxID=1033263 RepID=A0AAD7BWE1_MYCRO|nr:hypothetical protein B0H17DRAFT_1150324 [Mycena rosella]